MKNSYSFYTGVQPGANNLAKRLVGAATARQGGFDTTFKALGAADKDAADAELKRAQATREQNGITSLQDEPGWLSGFTGLARPLVEKAVQQRNTGNWGVIQPMTPNDDEGNPNAPIVLDRPTDAPPGLNEMALRAINRANQVRLATIGGKESSPETIAKASGEFQGQQITDDVQRDIAGGLVDRASARNQGGKLGQQIKVYDNIAGTGALFTPGGGRVDVNNPLAQSTIAENLGKAQEASSKAATAGEARVPPGYRLGPGGTLEAIPGGPADVRTGENELRRQEREAAAADRKAADLDKRVNHFSMQVEKTGVPQFEAALQDIKAQILASTDKEGDIAGMGRTGGSFPEFLLSDEGKALRQKVATLRNVILKDRSGAAVTDQELRRLLEELGTGNFKTDKQFLSAIDAVEKRFAAAKQNLVAGVQDDVLNEYLNRGGVQFERGTGAASPVAQPPQAAAAPPAKAPNNRAPAAIPEGTTGKSASGKDIIFKGGKWVYAQGGV